MTRSPTSPTSIPTATANSSSDTGKEIVAAAVACATSRPDEVIVMNPIYRDEVAAMLARSASTANVITADDPLAALA